MHKGSHRDPYRVMSRIMRHRKAIDNVSTYPLIQGLRLQDLKLNRNDQQLAYNDKKEDGFEGDLVEYICFLIALKWVYDLDDCLSLLSATMDPTPLAERILKNSNEKISLPKISVEKIVIHTIKCLKSGEFKLIIRSLFSSDHIIYFLNEYLSIYAGEYELKTIIIETLLKLVPYCLLWESKTTPEEQKNALNEVFKTNYGKSLLETFEGLETGWEKELSKKMGSTKPPEDV